MLLRFSRPLTAVVMVLLATGSAQPSAHSFKLEKPLASYPQNKSDLYDWIHGGTGPEFVQMSTKGYERVCSGDAACPSRAKKTRLNGEPATEAKSLSLAKIPKFGVVLAWLEVQPGELAEARYKIPKGGGKVYFIVEPVDNIVGRWTTVHVTKSGWTALGWGTFRRCANDTPDPTSLLGFGDCSKKQALRMERHRVAQAISTLKTQAQRDSAFDAFQRLFGDALADPTWVSCIHGCCIAEQ